MAFLSVQLFKLDKILVFLSCFLISSKAAFKTVFGIMVYVQKGREQTSM